MESERLSTAGPSVPAVSVSRTEVNRQVSAAVTGGDWTRVVHLLEHGQLSGQQKAWFVVEVSKAQDASEKLTTSILPYCSSDHVDRAVTQLVTEGPWKAVVRLVQGAGDTHLTWTVGDVRVDADLLVAVAGAQWYELPALLHQGRLGSPAAHRWAVLEACRRATQRDIIRYILPDCAADRVLDCVLDQLLSRGLWWTVGTLLGLSRRVSEAQRTRAVQRAAKEATTWEITAFILPHVSVNQWGLISEQLLRRQLWRAVESTLRSNVQGFTRYVLPKCEKDDMNGLMTHLVSVDHWDSVRGLLGVTGSRKQSWVIVQTNVSSTLLQLVAEERWQEVCSVMQDVSISQYSWAILQVFRRAGKEQITQFALPFCRGCVLPGLFKHLADRDFMEPLAWLLCRAVTDTLFQWGEARDESQTDEASIWDLLINHRFEVKDICKLYTSVHGEKVYFSTVNLYSELSWTPLFRLFSVTSAQATLSKVLCESFLNLLSTTLFCKQGTTVRSRSIHQQAQSAASMILKELGALDAVKEGLFAKPRSVESLLPTLHRLCTEFNRIAHGNTTNPLLVLSFIKSLLEGCFNRRQQLSSPSVILILLTCVPVIPVVQSEALSVMLEEKRWDVISQADLSHVTEQVRRRLLKAAVKQKRWLVVRQWVDHTLYDDQRRWVLRKAEKEKETDIVHLLTHHGPPSQCPGMDTACQDAGQLGEAIRQGQWDLCRRLMEQGVSRQQCLDALPHLLSMHQWTLVARVMELDVDDGLRKQVMQRATERREGSVVSRCLSTMQAKLSVSERDALFQKAVCLKMLQAVKPLVEEKDLTGIHHRDSALQQAIQQHQWDVVDHCTLFNADINAQDEEGHTPMHRMALQGDWEAVEELTKRGGHPSALDKEGKSVLHRAIEAEQWKAVTLLIKHHGDIHQAADPPETLYEALGLSERESLTPLQLLRDADRWDIIEYAAMHSSHVSGANKKGETILHTVCLSGLPTVLEKLTARGRDLTALTKRGHSALLYAVMQSESPQEMVAECIRLGFSTLQPQLTDIAALVYRMYEIRLTGLIIGSDDTELNIAHLPSHGRELMTSPLMLAVLRGLPVVVQMLYESGACSYRDLFRLQAELVHLTDPACGRLILLWKHEFHREVQWIYSRDVSSIISVELDTSHSFVVYLVSKSARALMSLSTSPRSLKSTCRLVISSRLRPGHTRATDVDQLPVYDSLKRYLLFSDLIDPQYGQGDSSEEDYVEIDTDDEEWW